jgi:hypothetical protein
MYKKKGTAIEKKQLSTLKEGCLFLSFEWKRTKRNIRVILANG